MRISNASAVLTLAFLIGAPFLVAQSPYNLAQPGYRYSFPRDHFNHPGFATEWWYYTGNLQSTDGHRFGFELTFFRQGVNRDPAQHTAWDVRDVYLAHLALSDLSGGRFYYTERTQRAGPGLAGVDEGDARIWNGNWQVRWELPGQGQVQSKGQGQGQPAGQLQDRPPGQLENKNGVQLLDAISAEFELHFTLQPQKPPVIHGENGISQKAAGTGHASHYISFTRLDTRGTVVLGGKSFDVTGLSWMDHEFFTGQLTPDQIGWDWLSLQLDDRTELMLFHIRRKDGSIDPFSAGTYVDAQGRTTHLRESDFVLVSNGQTWKSAATGATYPIRWKISIPRLGISLDAQTPLAAQELAGNSKLAPSYWEGAITLSGTRGTLPLAGRGYLEMTGYAQPVKLGQ